MATLYKFRFPDNTSFDHVDETLQLAVTAAESLHGEARMDLDVKFWSEPQNGCVVIDAATAPGKDLAVIFIGLLNKTTERRSYGIERIVYHKEQSRG